MEERDKSLLWRKRGVFTLLGKKDVVFSLFWDKRLKNKEDCYESRFRNSGGLGLGSLINERLYSMVLEETPHGVPDGGLVVYVEPQLDQLV